MPGPDGELTLPATFIYTAERNGLIQAVDRWVVGQAIQLIADRDRTGRDLRLEVNISGRSVTDADLLDFIVQEKYEMQKQCRRWSVALEAFLKPQAESVAVEQRPRNLESEVTLQRGATALKLQHRVAEMFLSASFPEDSTIFGASPNSDAEFILELAESLVQNSQKSSLNIASCSSTRARSFSSEMAIVAPLFLLAMKCHDRHVCQKAASLLAVPNRREGLIDAKMVLGILERVAMLKRQEEITPLGGCGGETINCLVGGRDASGGLGG